MRDWEKFPRGPLCILYISSHSKGALYTPLKRYDRGRPFLTDMIFTFLFRPFATSLVRQEGSGIVVSL